MNVQTNRSHPDHPYLTPGQPYLVIGIEADDFRLLNDRGEPCLYPPELFSILDPAEPAEWVHETGDDGERYAYPPALNATGFFEGKPEAVQTFWLTINHGLTAAYPTAASPASARRAASTCPRPRKKRQLRVVGVVGRLTQSGSA